jgi:CRP-like cAMP-binding protein
VTLDLSAIPALRELGAGQLTRLCEFAQERTLEDGEPLFRAEDESQELYWLLEGRLALSRDGEEQGLLGQGAMLGACSLAAVGRRACDARASGGTARLLCLDREAYLRLRSDEPTLALQLQEAIVCALARDVRALLL